MIWKEIIQKINNVEESIELQNLSFIDFNPWPYIRLEIINQIAKKNNIKNNRSPFIQNINRVYQSMIDYIKNPIRDETNEIVFFTRSSELQDVIDNKYFNRYSDSFIDFFEKDYKIKVLESQDSYTKKDKKLKNKDVSYIDFIIRRTFIISKIKYLFFKYKFNMDNLNLEVQKEFSLLLNKQKINFLLYYIYELSKVFEKILNKYNTKVVFLVCFYRSDAMAMSLACARLKIKTVEYQHGAQNDNHFMYSNWKNTPQKGYELIPDIFWMWGETNKKRIDNWAQDTTRHKAIVAGNLWLLYNINNKKSDSIKKIKNSKTTILVSLQGDHFLPNFFIDFLHTYGHDYNWYFRNHPRIPVSSRVENILNKYAIMDIKAVSNLDLYTLLRVIDINITGFSTVAFEAQSFSKSTIFIHENAKEGFKNLLGKNGLYYADNTRQLEIYINEFSSNSNIKDYYIVANKDIATNTLQEIIK